MTSRSIRDRLHIKAAAAIVMAGGLLTPEARADDAASSACAGAGGAPLRVEPSSFRQLRGKAIAAAAKPCELLFQDGSAAILAPASVARLTTLEKGHGNMLVKMRLERSALRLDLGNATLAEVTVGDVRVTVLGASAIIERLEGGQVQVSFVAGRRVSIDVGSTCRLDFEKPSVWRSAGRDCPNGTPLQRADLLKLATDPGAFRTSFDFDAAPDRIEPRAGPSSLDASTTLPGSVLTPPPASGDGGNASANNGTMRGGQANVPGGLSLQRETKPPGPGPTMTNRLSVGPAVGSVDRNLGKFRVDNKVLIKRR